MSIDIKNLIADALLELCNEKPLAKISIADIQESPACPVRRLITTSGIRMI